jgi:hypothetical protein
MKTALPLLLVALVAGCSAADPTPSAETQKPTFLPAPGGETRIIVTVVDGDGEPFRPDYAWWYYTPDEQGNQAKEYEALCANEACTRWAVTGAEAGRVYVAASYQREHPDPYCLFGGFDANFVELTTESVREVTLRLEENEMCQ